MDCEYRFAVLVDASMNRLLMALVAVVAVTGQVARADDWDGDGYDDGDGYGNVHGAQAADPGCGPMPTQAPWGQNTAQGSYQLQSRQRWVPGGQTQVWVPGSCEGRRHHRRHGGGRFCTQGGYQTIWTQGHYETQQEWVWVPYSSGYGQRRHAGTVQFQGRHGRFSFSTY